MPIVLRLLAAIIVVALLSTAPEPCPARAAARAEFYAGRTGRRRPPVFRHDFARACLRDRKGGEPMGTAQRLCARRRGGRRLFRRPALRRRHALHQECGRLEGLLAGATVGWDFGGDGADHDVVCSLPATEAIYQRFAGIEGSAYFIGGFG